MDTFSRPVSLGIEQLRSLRRAGLGLVVLAYLAGITAIAGWATGEGSYGSATIHGMRSPNQATNQVPPLAE